MTEKIPCPVCKGSGCQCEKKCPKCKGEGEVAVEDRDSALIRD